MNKVDKKILLDILIILALIIYNLWDTSSHKFSCDDWANSFKKEFECNLVLTKYSNESGIVTLSGYDPSTKQKVKFDDDSKWLSSNQNKFVIGDTIIKQKGRYTIYIIHHNCKKEAIPLTCDKKIYHD